MLLPTYLFLVFFSYEFCDVNNNVVMREFISTKFVIFYKIIGKIILEEIFFEKIILDQILQKIWNVFCQILKSHNWKINKSWWSFVSCDMCCSVLDFKKKVQFYFFLVFERTLNLVLCMLLWISKTCGSNHFHKEFGVYSIYIKFWFFFYST